MSPSGGGFYFYSMAGVWPLPRYPGGISACSRWLSEERATPPDSDKTRGHPGRGGRSFEDASHIYQPVDAAIPPGCGPFHPLSGGVARSSLNHRLQARKPPASGSENWPNSQYGLMPIPRIATFAGKRSGGLSLRLSRSEGPPDQAAQRRKGGTRGVRQPACNQDEPYREAAERTRRCRRTAPDGCGAARG